MKGAVAGVDQDKSRLARVGAIVSIAVGVATIASIGWTIFHKENTEVQDYQNQVLATCEQVHRILTAQHNEVFEFPEFGVRHEAAVNAQRRWYGAFEQDITLVREKSRDRETLAEVNTLFTDSPTPEASIKLNSAMTNLAGKSCQSTG